MPTPMPQSPFITDDQPRFVLDEAAFMAAIEPAPLFIADPSPQYMRAADIMPIVQVLAAH